MGHIPWYNSSQEWANINTKSLSQVMVKAFKNPNQVKLISEFEKKFVMNNFSYKTVGSEILKVLKSK